MSDALDDLAADETERYHAMVAAQQAQILAQFRANFGDEATLAMLRAFNPGYRPTAEQARGIRQTLHVAGVKPPRLDA